ncbi:UvrD/REP helicase family protein [Tritrichomonas foetus]|uniref:DNA 3'-5' helicase n=1 Tax=Tritrichomonas foetus TaxID=1144522 RepID=A0A1J4KQE5_9EUKA|nr:UvrD/REP helicase family protein [Tritrichomonas foetus]|eukprot:OHT11910.1 UvrD/REP helicase family protein [Tritrichomonas foetus]
MHRWINDTQIMKLWSLLSQFILVICFTSNVKRLKSNQKAQTAPFIEEVHFFILKKMKSYLDDLNEEQREAVTASFESPLFVYAGAGSGKTRTLICRITNMIMSGIDPAHILAITFTRKAADEIRERLKQFVGPRAAQVVTSTFHQLCLNILKENPFILNFSKDEFKVADSNVQTKIIRNGCIQLIGRDKKTNPNALRIMTSKMLNFVKLAKTHFKTPDDYQDDQQYIFKYYQDQLKSHRLIDFFDFLTFTEKLLKNYPRVALVYRQLYQYILIDEFQDTSEINFQIIKLILGKDSKRITIVGDARQSIYAFRGANPANIKTFLDFYPDAQRVVLNQNYRSTQTILNAAQSLISNGNTDLDFSSPLISRQEQGDLIKVINADDALAEVDQICTEIEKLVYPGSIYQYRDIVIMFRVRKISSDIEMELFRRNIPYTHKRGTRFFMRRDVREVISYARLLLSFEDDGPDPNQLIANSIETVINVPNRNIGEKQIKMLRDKSQASNLSMLTIMKRITEKEVGKVTFNKFQAFINLLKQLHNQICVINPNLATDSCLSLIIKMTGLLEEDKNDIVGSNGVDEIEELNDALTDYINDKKETLDLLVQEANRFHKQLLQIASSTSNNQNHNNSNNSNDQNNSNPNQSQFHTQTLSQMTSTSNLRKFINAITLEGVGDVSRNAVTLSTIHQMKGLESPICFIMRFNQGVLPVNDKVEEEGSAEGFEATHQLEEERRIAYVAMTRAKNKLFISMCNSYRGKLAEPSMFLGEIDHKCLTNKTLTMNDKKEINDILKFVDDDFDDISI